MNKEQYVKKILKNLRATDRTKERIKLDILTDIENKEEQGLSIEEIILQKGTPQRVAAAFNQAYSNTQMLRWYYLQKSAKLAAILLLSAAVLVFMYSAFGGAMLMQDASVSVIGGADGPTRIFVAAGPSAFFDPNTVVARNMAGCALLLAGGACVAAYYIMRKIK